MLLEWIWLTGSGFLFICCTVLSQHVVKIIIEKKKNVWGKSKWNAQQVGAEHWFPDFYSWWSWFHLGISVKNTIKFLVYLSHNSTWAPKIWQQWKSFSGNQSLRSTFTSYISLPVWDMNQTFIERSDSDLLIQIKHFFLNSCFVYADSTDPFNEKGELRVSFIESGFITSSQIWYFCFYGSHSCF